MQPCHNIVLFHRAEQLLQIASVTVMKQITKQYANSHQKYLKNSCYLHALQNCSALFFQDSTWVLNSLSRASPNVPHSNGHPGNSCLTHLIMLLEIPGENQGLTFVLLMTYFSAIYINICVFYFIVVRHAFLIMCKCIHVVSTRKENKTFNFNRSCCTSNLTVHSHKLKMNSIFFGYKRNLVLC